MSFRERGAPGDALHYKTPSRLPLSYLILALSVTGRHQARWMLSYHEIPHITSTYTPVLGEPWLRFKAGKMLSSQRVTAPLLVTQRDGGGLHNGLRRCWAWGAHKHPPKHACSGVLCESLDIAQWADDHSNRQDGVKLLPAHQLQDIKRCHPASTPACVLAGLPGVRAVVHESCCYGISPD